MINLRMKKIKITIKQVIEKLLVNLYQFLYQRACLILNNLTKKTKIIKTLAFLKVEKSV
jgi:hypothetical protein